jgi:hypothetical protein
MSRGFDFDSLGIDDFRDPKWRSEPYSTSREGRSGRGNSSQAEASVRLRLQKFHEAEFNADQISVRSREDDQVKRPPISREAQQFPILSERVRTEYRDRASTYSLRASEIHTLTEVGKFRVVSVEDLAKHAYAGDRPRLESDLRNLIRRRLAERRGTSSFKKNSQQVVALTKRGERFVRGFLSEDQAVYSGFVKPKEAQHDASLYRLYHKAAEEIEREGGKVLRVQLDYELAKGFALDIPARS